MNDARVARVRRRVRRGSIALLLLVAAAPACIFEEGNYQGGGRIGNGASTAATGAASGSASSTATSTSTSTATSTTTADMDSGNPLTKEGG